MFKEMKMGTKIACLAALLIVLTGVVSFVGYNGLSGVVDRVEKADDVNRMLKTMLATRQQEKNFIIRADKKYIDKVKEEVVNLKKQANETRDKFKDPANKQQMDDVLTAIGKYENAFGEYTELAEKQKLSDAAMVKNARALQAEAEEMRKEQKDQYQVLRSKNASADQLDDKLSKADDANRIIKWVLECRRQEKNFIIRSDKMYLDRVAKYVQDITNLAANMKTRFHQVKNQQQTDHMIILIQGYKASFDEWVMLKDKQEAADTAMVAAARTTQEVSDKARADQKTKMENQISNANSMMMIGTGVAILLGALLAFFIIRGITRAIGQVIEGLGEGAEQVAAASSQVSTASQSLAEGASEQAASIEETSSSLEEMSSMTKQNADNANQADNLMKEANQVVGSANDSMTELTGSMQEISNASEETHKIVKTIDEVAFQTNLLALNAAVEAARAGEAGAGFAVVADEVRNLAIRAADAAKNTAELIEGTVKKVKDGSDLVNRTNEEFGKVAESSSKVNELVSEIAAASNEQAQGIGQVNTAVTELDKVVQQNAANAEESASASEEMNAQAEQMKGFVNDLIALVGGSANNGKSVLRARGKAPKAVAVTGKALAAPVKKEVVVHNAREVNPEQIIPMDDDFKDF
ncbi:MAG: methyl-accepting chemotaxis protein [Desulfobacteraceae bacterium Eth-SRB2]|nr:MAG: methyl-accepting chemotaxis protein [Desulfobacteraceae bacterium Eth-SRB2]